MRAWHCANLHPIYIWSVEVYFSTSASLKRSPHSMVLFMLLSPCISTAEESIVAIISDIVYILINNF